MSDSLTPYDDLVAIYEAAMKAGDSDRARKASELLQAGVVTYETPWIPWSPTGSDSTARLNFDGKSILLTGTTVTLQYNHDRLWWDVKPDPPKPIDPLDVEYDGVALRQLIEWDAAAGREEFVLDPDSPSRSIAAVAVRAAFSSSQRAAVSAHWSAELRKRTDAAKQKDRNQVTMEQDDE